MTSLDFKLKNKTKNKKRNYLLKEIKHNDFISERHKNSV